MKLSLAPVRRVTTSTASARPAGVRALPGQRGLSAATCAPSRLEPAFAPMLDLVARHR